MSTGQLHILGIGGTFMGGLAQLARARGYEVTGSDQKLYPPMSEQLEQAGIHYHEGHDPATLPEQGPVVVGNVMTRGMPVIEALLDRGLSYTSGPQWLAEHVLHDRWVLAVAGTHGKTTTASLLAWILEHAGLSPGFLIGGVPGNFGVSARMGETPFFVIEADEYDSAFFDKRAKFVHYRPRTLVLNNLEFDHADIYPDLAAIERQFHHLVRTIPGQGLILAPAGDAALERVLEMGCWTPVERITTDPYTGDTVSLVARPLNDDASEFEVLANGVAQGRVAWEMTGQHNLSNALAALGAARHAGVPLAAGIAALPAFRGVRRRQELRAEIDGIRVIDDFAHHPTAIRLTLEGLRGRVAPGGRLIAVLEPRSNTMRMGVHADALGAALERADAVHLYHAPEIDWSTEGLQRKLGGRLSVAREIESLLQGILATARPGDTLVIMSNGGFDGLHQRLIAGLQSREPSGTPA
ncbi:MULTISPECIES: UDP-N-acetylmuramate:L-alanyl-gamma-D-glutamyl-meso-diaminopimelate ligase [unclassified Thioalkalivibrio]|uniref:UDP-N-acetylmuramate:L-alanyl-gamma-D-glutamyl- meso-diaminopimelate ligase n=1 Tax=unclassified Thioalkalivibrio TaxID=2621013 RepID=UPI000377D16D|nr:MULTISPECIES: UDP-N-acetylmuramate:L-alanyl-gamma-D-glutamyl-meso-diaminopimelate ligase [unclassified Thioalkalivibrio]